MEGQVVLGSGEQRAEGAGQANGGLDGLARLTEAELARRYEAGSASAELLRLEGRPKGRMLTVRGLATGRPYEALRRFAGHGAFPWGGKSFFKVDAERGRGINRVRLGGARFEWYPFDTRLDVSLLDGRPTLLLDYDKPENPFFIRRIRDELRAIAPGLFLGPAMWRDDRGGAAFVLWFALDLNAPEPA
ncbi:MAG: hypothetical protein IPG04_30520 [Polyangiaceae bacterium]|jgi:hypothetical protein|nr:hypothetical protein [Polyangiaceae bacterium]